jgi:hypothetical protein
MYRYDLFILSFSKVKVSMPTTRPFIFLFYALPQASVIHLLINMHVYVWISEGGLKNVCIYVQAYILTLLQLK